MEVSKLTISKETMRRSELPTTSPKKGQLRWERVAEADASGELSKIKSRAALARFLGDTESQGPAYTWATRSIKNKFITETLSGFDEFGRPVYEYHIGVKPIGHRGKAKRNENRVSGESAPIAENIIVPVKETQKEMDSPTSDKSIKIKITKGELSIEIEMYNDKQACDLLTAIIRGGING